MAIRTVQGIILHRREVTETSLIISVYSDRAGKVALMAKGARRKKSPFLGRVELFSLCSFTYYENLRRGLNTLSECDVITPFTGLRDNFAKFLAACTIAELTDIATGLSEPNPGLYDLVRRVFSAMSDFPSLELLSRYFELHLLSNSGYALEMIRCGNCHASGRPLQRFSARTGGMICSRCHSRGDDAIPVSSGSTAVLRFLKTNLIETLSSLRINRVQEREVKAVLRRAILYYFERYPRSWRVVEKMMREKAAA